MKNINKLAIDHGERIFVNKQGWWRKNNVERILASETSLQGMRNVNRKFLFTFHRNRAFYIPWRIRGEWQKRNWTQRHLTVKRKEGFFNPFILFNFKEKKAKVSIIYAAKTLLCSETSFEVLKNEKESKHVRW